MKISKRILLISTIWSLTSLYIVNDFLIENNTYSVLELFGKLTLFERIFFATYGLPALAARIPVIIIPYSSYIPNSSHGNLFVIKGFLLSFFLFFAGIITSYICLSLIWEIIKKFSKK